MIESQKCISEKNLKLILQKPLAFQSKSHPWPCRNEWMNEWYLIFVTWTGAYYAVTKLQEIVKQRRYKSPNPQPSNGSWLRGLYNYNIKRYLATQPCPEDLWFSHFECGKKPGFSRKHLPHPGEKTTDWTIGQPI